MIASPKEILTKWLVRYQLDRGVDDADAYEIRFCIDAMTNDQRWQLVDWLRERRVPHIEGAWREGDQVALRFEAFRSHLRRRSVSVAVNLPQRQDVLA